MVWGHVKQLFGSKTHPNNVALSPNMKEIWDLLSELRKADPRRTVFGSESHNYRLNPCLSENQVFQFEKANGIVLPTDYRDFILQIGNGGAGPQYGIYPLNREQKAPERLSGNFDYTERAVWTWSDEDDTAADSDTDDEEPFEFGTLKIGTQGCTYYNVLILTGPSRGQIWSEDWGEEIIPIHKTFHEFYVSWAKRCLETIKRQPLMRKARVGMPLAELDALLGPGRYRWEHSQSVIDYYGGDYVGSFLVGYPNTNASYRINAQDRVAAINKMSFIS